MRILTVVGARPQFVKAAMLSRAIGRRGADGIREVLVHTGQHHDANMSEVFFSELGIPQPSYNLGICGGGHGAMTGRMLEALENVILTEKPHCVLVYGDTNSTLAGALAAAKLHVPVAHVEAGLRSFDMRMPEEVNRVLTDRVSTLLFCPTRASVDNLEREGMREGVRLVGDVMYDVALFHGRLAREKSLVLQNLGLRERTFALATCHRQENTDDPDRLREILTGLGELARRMPVVLPLHPRTRLRAEAHGLVSLLEPLTVLEPLPFLDMVALEQAASLILTDSGGVQKEAYFHGVPCITLRERTEWVETVEAGRNTLAGASAKDIVRAAEAAPKPVEPGSESPYGDGDAAGRIVQALLERFA